MDTQSIIEQADAPQPISALGPEDLRPRMRSMWSAVAPAWSEHADFLEARHADSTAQILALAAPQRGERVLDLACGPGGIGLAAAKLVAPGEAVLSDVAAEMIAIAAQRATDQGIDNVSTCVLDLQCIEQPDESYDVVLCREGLMFVPEPAAALREVRRILRPGGRAAFAVWGPRERNPWMSLIFDAVAAQLGRPVPPPGVPGPFSLEDAGRVAELMRDAGLENVEVRDVPVPLQSASFDDWWSRTSALAGPLSQILARMPAATKEALVADLRERTAPYRVGDGLEFPGVTLLATGGRAA
ncbi:MAG TPA: class I SAM-dependent methyltransferase [Solirubrobacteraceae bacterium]|nr:class I SAM-dependent methyltransferase [Solirubrobacteraceae bacterium]